MITYVNKDNAVQYNNLYRKAEKALNLAEFEINSLEKYFYYLPDLMELTGLSDDKYSQTLGRRYAILPVDEDYFFIDANSRKITVPESFRKNGIAVKGDETAEIIYFKINRYFDFMDLNNADIFIQWQQNGEEPGLSNEWVRDIESDPDYLIFGWALDRSITEVAGPLKFSIRFVDWKTDNNGNIIQDINGNREVIYSLSTLEAIATINDALDIDMQNAVSNISNVESIIKNRVKRALVVGADVADVPEFTLKLLDWVKSQEDYIINNNDQYEVDLKNGEYTFKIQAYSTDAGQITYHWFEVSDLKKRNEIEGEPIKDSYELIEEETIAQSGHIYYIKDSDNYIPDATLKTGDTISANTRYERYGSCIVSTAGTYIGQARNDIKYNSAVMPNLDSETIDTSYGPIIVPGPSTPTISLMEGDSYSGYILGQNAIELNPVVTKGNVKDNLTYQWSRTWSGAEDEGIIDGATTNNYKLAADAPQGKYILTVTSSRNNAEKVISSNEFIVTYPAATPIISYDKETMDDGDTVTVKVDFANDYHNGLNKLTYQWYKIINAKGDLEPVAGATSSSFSTTIEGNYKCKVVNTYNGNSSDPTTSTSFVQVF